MILKEYSKPTTEQTCKIETQLQHQQDVNLLQDMMKNASV